MNCFGCKTREGRARLKNTSFEGWRYRGPGVELQRSPRSGGIFLVSAQQPVPPRTGGFGLEIKLPETIRGICPFPFAVPFPHCCATSGDEQKASPPNAKLPPTPTPPPCDPPGDVNPQIFPGFQASPKHPSPLIARALSTLMMEVNLRGGTSA